MRAQVIREDIQAAKALGTDGVVVGFLLPDGSVNVGVTEQTLRQSEDLVRPPYMPFLKPQRPIIHEPRA